MDEKNETGSAAPEMPGKQPPLRRVGSFTLGACLIAAGAFFLCYHFVPGFDWQLALKIVPAAGLVMLGGEVLFFAARPGRWKYDFWSVLICLVLMGGCFCLCCRWCGRRSAPSAVRPSSGWGRNIQRKPMTGSKRPRWRSE